MERVVNSLKEVLSETEQRVMQRVLLEESAARDHIVVYLSGAHAYGFPSPDSDLDLKSIHIASTHALLGFDPPAPTADRTEVIEGVEIDYTSNELAHALSGVLKGNGNFLERILGKLRPMTSPLFAELQPIVMRSLSKRVHRHYRGFAQNQLQFLEQTPSVKKLLYVLRTTLTGTHLLREGEVEPDLTRLIDRYEVPDARSLIESKRAGERTGIDPAILEEWRPRLATLFANLDRAHEQSQLPEAPANEGELQDWLIEARIAALRMMR
jgi:uncharacterized protein